jgi:hypothetical protein
VHEMDIFNQIVVDREMHMIELKREINAFHAELGNQPPYDLAFTEGENEDTLESLEYLSPLLLSYGLPISV